MGGMTGRPSSLMSSLRCIMQLLQWYKRRNSSVERCRLYRTAPQSPAAGRCLVPKLVATPRSSSLDPRGAFVVQTPTTVYVWEVGIAAGDKVEPDTVGTESHAGPRTVKDVFLLVLTTGGWGGEKWTIL